MSERKRVLGLDHEGTPEERHAIATALNGLKGLRRDFAESQKRRSLER
jgi:hypothetical protein